MICKTTVQPVHPKFQTILVTADFSDESLTAVRYALNLRQKVTLVHVVQQFFIDHPLGAEMARQTHVPPIKQAAAYLEQMAEDF